MMIEMLISKGNYNDNRILGLGNSLLNYLITNQVFGEEFKYIKFDKRECLCILKDEKQIQDVVCHNDGVYKIFIYEGSTLLSTKYATISKLIEYLRNLNTMFENRVDIIKITKIDNAEIL